MGLEIWETEQLGPSGFPATCVRNLNLFEGEGLSARAEESNYRTDDGFAVKR
jgi:hypothetical protein